MLEALEDELKSEVSVGLEGLMRRRNSWDWGRGGKAVGLSVAEAEELSTLAPQSA